MAFRDPPRFPPADRVESLLRRYVPTVLTYHHASLSEGDRRALAKLVEASSAIDEIYWRQRSAIGVELRDALRGRSDMLASALGRLLTLNYGPWDCLDDGRPFWGDAVRPEGGTLYPADLTRDEFNAYVQAHPAARGSLMSTTTVVRRDGDDLVAVPYAEAYREQLAAVRGALLGASEHATDDSFRAFLRSRAQGLVSGDLSPSERQWIHLTPGPIDVAIGPYEVYDDGLLGLKASYESTVVVRHPLSDRLGDFERVLLELDAQMPGGIATGRAQRRIAIGVYDVVHAGGMTNMGTKAVAAILPNDEHVRATEGGRLLLFNNVAAAKFAAVLKPIANRVLSPRDADLVQEQAFVLHTLLHEAAHALSPGFVSRSDGGPAMTIHESLRERYSTIEETRADLVGLVYLSTLIRSELVPATTAHAASATFVAGCIRTLRFGLTSDYARGAAMTLTFLHERGTLRLDKGRLALDLPAVERAIRELSGRVQAIATQGDYAAAGALIDRLARMPEWVAPLLSATTDLPVDVEFVFDHSGLRGA